MQSRLAPGITFTKMHGLGNNFILIPWSRLSSEGTDPVLSRLAWTLCHQQMGVGADGLAVFTTAPTTGDLEMLYWNADGSSAEQCVNALRCVAFYHHMRSPGSPRCFGIKTPAGFHPVRVLENGDIHVTLGVPIFGPGETPGTGGGEESWRVPLSTPAGDYEGVAVCLGNPHLIIEGSCRDFPLHQLGPSLEKHPFFPAGVNVTIAEMRGTDSIWAYTWERGVGLTLACGSAAAATLAALVRLGRCDRSAEVYMPGGDLRVSWSSDDSPIVLQGGASFVCDGTWIGEEVPRSVPMLGHFYRGFTQFLNEDDN
ncbi:diaminopimelate epimerase [Pasteuria penetrans]|uniref:diaminopimelate epimerase n=1 Tax=Pasteuria penetrans TaxID=86005 RepID=UPI000FA21FFF|nr:diaminopimelate epimerase [Pasteuria penetrans]